MRNKNKLDKYVVPVLVITYGESHSDAIDYVEKALDTSEFMYEDGIVAFDVLHEDVELYDE